MTSILKADTIQDTDGNNIINESGNTITIGASGDTTNIIGTLQNNGSALASGITEFDMYRLTSSITSDTDPIQSNLERVDDATFSKIGTGVTNSSGVFSFPSTGLYQVGHIGQIYPAANDTVTFNIYATANDGGAWDQIVQSNFYCGSSRASGKVTNFSLVNVTDVSNVKVKFTAGSFASSTSEINGATDFNYTCFFFMRVGDSQ